MEGYKPQDFSFFHRSEKLVQQGLINDDWWMMTDDLMDYILSGYKLYENKGETWKYGQVLTKIQNIIVSLQRICDDFG